MTPFPVGARQGPRVLRCRCTLRGASGPCRAAERGKTPRRAERRQRGAAPRLRRLSRRWVWLVEAAVPPGRRQLPVAGPAAGDGSRAPSGAASPAPSAARPTSCLFQGAQQHPGPMPCGEPGCRGPVGSLPPGGLSAGKGRAEPAHLPFVRSRAGVGGQPRTSGIPPCMGGRCWGGRLLPARPGSFAWPGRRVGLPESRSCSPLSATGDRDGGKNPFRKTLRGDDLPRTVVPRVSVAISPRVRPPLPPDPREGSAGKRGQSRRATSEGSGGKGREGRVCPCAAQRSADRDGWAGEPRCFAASAFGGPAAAGALSCCSSAACSYCPRRETPRWEGCACGGPVLCMGRGPPACPGTSLFFRVTLADSCEVQGRVFPSGNWRAPTQCHCVGAPVWELGLCCLCAHLR